MITSQNLLLNDVVVQSSSHVESDMDGETVLLSVENGKYYNLGQIGSRIWETIVTPTTVGVLIETLLTEYDVEQEMCQEQVLSFLGDLSAEKLILIKYELRAE